MRVRVPIPPPIFFFFSQPLPPLFPFLSQPHASTVAARLRDSPSVPAFLVELRALAGRALAEEAEAAGPTASSRLPPPAATAAAAAALEAAGA